MNNFELVASIPLERLEEELTEIEFQVIDMFYLSERWTLVEVSNEIAKKRNETALIQKTALRKINKIRVSMDFPDNISKVEDIPW